MPCRDTNTGVVCVDLLLPAAPLSLSNVLFLPPLMFLLTPPLTALLPGLLHRFKLICCVPLAKLGHIAPRHWLGSGKEDLFGETMDERGKRKEEGKKEDRKEKDCKRHPRERARG